MGEDGKSEKKCRCKRKVLKVVLWSMLGVVLFALLAVAALPLWISPVSTGIANSIVPKYTGTDFHIEKFYLNPYSGRLRIEGVKLSNPDGFGDAAAFSVSSVSVDVEVTSLLSDTIVVNEVVIEDPFASYYSHDGKNNFDVILANVNEALGSKEEKPEPQAAEEKKDEKSSEKKIVIGHLRIAGTRVKLVKSDIFPNIAVPTIDVRDIGKSSGGASLDDAWNEIVSSVTKAMGSIGDGFGALGGMLGDGAKDAAASLGGLTDKVGSSMGSVKDSAAVSGTVEATKNASSAVGGAAKSAAGAVSDAAKSSADVVGDVTKSTVNAVGDVTKGAADAVGDTAKKATEGVKNLFKGLGK